MEDAVIEAAIVIRFKMFLKNIVSLAKPAWTGCNEVALGIETEPDHRSQRMRGSERSWWQGEPSERARHDDNFHYSTIDYWNIRKVVQVLKPGPEDIFYDIGSGMGRILCVLARKPLRKCVGVELLEPLCHIARRNAMNLRGRKAPVEIVCGDATTADLSDGTIYFMFNPFGAETLRDTLQNIKDSLSINPRSIKIVYYNAVHEYELSTLSWLDKVREFNSFGGHRIMFWQNRPSEGGPVTSSAAKRVEGGPSRARPGCNQRVARDQVRDNELRIARHDEQAGEILSHETLMPATVRIFRSISELQEIRGIWMQMQRHPNADIDFYLTVLQSLKGALRPHVIVAYHGANPVALLIGRLENSRMDFKIGYADFLKPRARLLTFIYGGVMGNPCAATCEILVQEVVKSLREGEADIAFFNHLRADSPLYVALGRLHGLLRRGNFAALQTHRVMTVPGSPDELWRRFSPKVRKNQRWQAKQLLNDHCGNVTVRCFCKTSDLERMIQDVEQVAKKTYQRALRVGFIDNAEMAKHLHLKAEKGWLRTYVLYVQDRPCAFWSGTLYQGTFHSDFMGYDPDYSRYSPGMYLLIRTIEEFSKRRGDGDVTVIDFGLGDAQYKEILGDSQWQDVSVHIFAPTLWGLTLNALRTPIIFADRISKMALERTRLLRKIKRLWRKKATQKERRRGDQVTCTTGTSPPGRERRETVTAE